MNVQEAIDILQNCEDKTLELMVRYQLDDHSRTVVAYPIEVGYGEIEPLWVKPSRYAEAYGGGKAETIYDENSDSQSLCDDCPPDGFETEQDRQIWLKEDGYRPVLCLRVQQ